MAVAPSWLNLAQFGLYRDLRKLIYAKLEPFDRALVRAAHHIKPVKLDEHFAASCARRGYLSLLQWAHEKGCPLSENTCSAAAASRSPGGRAPRSR